MQNQLVCSGCRTVLLYPSGSPNVRCTICNVVTAVPPPGMEMDRMVCSGCRRQLMYEHGASRVRCSCCQTVSVMRVAAPPPPAAPNNFAHVNCGNCRTLLMYPAGAPSVRCSLCQSITNVNRRETRDTRVNVPVNVPGSTSAPTPVKAHSQSQTIIVQNPMSVDESGKLVRNLVVGVTT